MQKPHNHHAVGLVIRLTGENQKLSLIESYASAKGIRHMVAIGVHPGSGRLLRSLYVASPFTQETAINHCRNCDAIVVVDAGQDFQKAAFDELIQMAEAGQNQKGSVIQLRNPADDSPIPAGVPAWLPGQHLPLLGVTIVTPGYEEIGAEAIRRWQQFTGWPCLALHAPSDQDAFRLKLQLPEFLPRQCVCYFDADLWFLRAPQFPTVKAGEVWAVPDAGIHDPTGFVVADCQNHQINPDRYCNSGLWLADFRHQGSREAWSMAMDALGCMKWADYGDQSAWNWALQHSPIELRFLTPAHNFFLHSVRHGYSKEIPGAIIGLHAAGVPLERKFDHLTRYAEAFGYEVREVDTPEAPAIKSEPEPLCLLPPPPMVSRQFFPPPEDINDSGHIRAIEEAFHTLNDETASFDQRASAKCYLTYRTIDGLITLDEWQQKVADIELPLPQKSFLVLRWAISHLMANSYLQIASGSSWTSFTCEGFEFDMMKGITKDYPPQILNLIRFRILDAYRTWLLPDGDLGEIDWLDLIERLTAAWIESWKNLDTTRYPYRWTEAHGDLHAMQTLMFIARAAGALSFEDRDWCPVEACARDGYFGRALRKLGEINPERALWK